MKFSLNVFVWDKRGMLFISFVQTLLSISHNIRQRLIVQFYIFGKYENMLEAAVELFMHQFNYFCQLIFRGICVTEHHQTKYTKVKIITLETKTTGSTNSIFPLFHLSPNLFAVRISHHLNLSIDL